MKVGFKRSGNYMERNKERCSEVCGTEGESREVDCHQVCWFCQELLVDFCMNWQKVIYSPKFLCKLPKVLNAYNPYHANANRALKEVVTTWNGEKRDALNRVGRRTSEWRWIGIDGLVLWRVVSSSSSSWLLSNTLCECLVRNCISNLIIPPNVFLQNKVSCCFEGIFLCFSNCFVFYTGLQRWW